MSAKTLTYKDADFRVVKLAGKPGYPFRAIVTSGKEFLTVEADSKSECVRLMRIAADRLLTPR